MPAIECLNTVIYDAWRENMILTRRYSVKGFLGTKLKSVFCRGKCFLKIRQYWFCPPRGSLRINTFILFLLRFCFLMFSYKYSIMKVRYFSP